MGVLVAGTLGCAPTVTVTPLGAGRTYPATPDTVTIPLYSVQKPECPYDEIAAITAEGNRTGDVVLAALRDKARTIGGQAIVGYSQSTRVGGDGKSELTVRSGTAIRFRSAECMK